MKTIKFLCLLLVISAATFYSCSDSDPIENHAATSKSIALRTAINEIKKVNDITGRSAANPFCFDFVYPISLSLSNGTNVTVTSFTGLVSLLAGESTNLYVDGIAFPFSVMHGGAVQVIDTEEEFIALLINCGFSTWNDNLGTSYCFDIVFPVSVTSPNGTYDIHTIEEFNAYLNAPANGQMQINYPVSVLYNGQVVVINNIYEFYQMIDNCDGCVCSQEYAPVCIQTPVGVIQYGNLCYAQCAGYSQNDIVDCNPNNTCNINNLTVTTGTCSATGYVLTLDFDYANAGSTTFEVHNSSGGLVGTFPLTSLPLTITNYLFTGQNTADFLTVNISGSTTCVATQQWSVPNCGNPTCESLCPTNFDPVCVQTANGIQQFSNECYALCAGYTQADFVDCGVMPNNFGTALGNCFSLVYPVQIQSGGQVITANDNGTVLQYWFPNSSPIPAFVYPVMITQSAPTGPVTTTVNGYTTFVGILNNCN